MDASTNNPTAHGKSIFVCYRRADSSWTTDRIYDWLDREFSGAVFRDVDAIPYGVDFREHIRAVLDSCRIMLVVIGPDWLDIRSESGERRLDEPQDHVRIEIETALARKDVRVIPLLVRGARVPTSRDLPPAIEALAYRNGPSIRRDPDFKHDMERLIRQMRLALEENPEQESHPPTLSQMPEETSLSAEAESALEEKEAVANLPQESAAPESHPPPPLPMPEETSVSAKAESGFEEKEGVSNLSKQSPARESHPPPSPVSEETSASAESAEVTSSSDEKRPVSKLPTFPFDEKAHGKTSTARWVIMGFILILLVLGAVFLLQTRQETPTAQSTTVQPSEVQAQRWPVAGKPWVNSLGMKFVPVSGTDVLFSVWETRVRDFEAFVEATGHDPTDGSWTDPGFEQSGNHPVVKVNWNDARAFCKWLTDKERKEGRIGPGQEYRLPTDHEWSCAVGIGDREYRDQTPKEKDGKIKNVYPWGKQWPPPVEAGNYRVNDDGYPKTSPVGKFKVNSSGIYDLGGNVWEWCEDKYSPSDSRRVLRGASWSNIGPDRLLSSLRGGVNPVVRYDGGGFRCVLVVESSRKAG